MKQIEVVAAILHKDGAYLATQRGYGEFEGMWEFPGGKIEQGETPEIALKREIQEELNVDIVIEKYFCTISYNYTSFHLIMHCYLCGIKSGEIKLQEHRSAKWLSIDAIDDVVWLPADKDVINKLKLEWLK